jgi:hypothetical protein
VLTVSVIVPELHAAWPAVVPSEKMLSPASPSSCSGTGPVAAAPFNPEIVTTASEPSVEAKLTSVARVTVIRFVAPARGLLWPIAFVVKVAESTHRQLSSTTTNKANQ